MLKKVCAVILLGLVVSPFTVPFQTFDPQRSSPVIDQRELDSAVDLLTTETGRLKIAPALGLVVVSPFVPEPHPASFIRSIAPASSVSQPAVFSTILRL